MRAKLIKQLIEHEGEVLTPYKCPAGKLTIGVGRNIEDNGIRREESRYMLTNDIAECESDLRRVFDNFEAFSENRRVALVDLRFNLGPSRFRSFKKMIAAIQRGDWLHAACEAMDSRWAHQVQKSRVDTITRQLAEG